MDIDKLFLSGLNYKTEGVENIYGYVEQRLVKESELTEEHQLQNKIIDMYLALLIDKKDNGGPRNVQILHRSIDNDTDLAKSVLKDIEGSGKSKTETPYSFYSLARQTASKNDYITGKVGIGPFALNNNNQILTMIYHISFRESQSSLLSTLGLSRLDKQLDVDGNSIMSWISAMINAHVDIAKDPWISRLNVNPFSYNITNLLLRTGWGGNTFYFLTQPIMKQMADAYVKASSQYMQQNGSTYSRQQQSIKDVAEQYFGKDVTFDGNTLDDALSLIYAGDKESIQAINEAIKKLLESEQFKQDARDYAQGNDVADQKGLKSRQLGIYLAYVQFSEYANALANLVKYCKIDTKKHGKSAAEQLVYKEGFDELFEFATDEDGVLIKKGDVGALFEPAGLLDLVEHSYVGTKTRNAISLTKVILGRQFMSSTTGFIQMLRQLNTMAGNTSLSVSFVQSAQKALSAAIKSQFFNDYASRISDNPRYMHDLVNSSSEDLEFSYDASTNSMSITGNKHSLKSYVGQPILLWYKDKDGNLQQYIPRDKNGNALPLKVLTAKDDKIQLNISLNGNFNGVCRLLGGANTIFDRLSRLKPMIYHNNDYSDLQGNLLLEMLIPGKLVEYSPKDAVLGERPDTYDDLKFVKLQNFVDDGGINTNYIINAWNELLEYQNDKQPQVAEYIRNFARDLVVYAFITSGDTQGFTKMFKYVPASWRKKSGYADFINRKLVQLNSIPTVDLNDVLLNNWYDNKLVPTYQFYSKDANGKRSSNFIGVAKMNSVNGNKQTLSAYPTILAALKKNDEGMYEPSIAVESSPKFIKIPRSYNHYDSQRQYNVYQLYGFARHDSGIMYPVYVLVQPRGTKVSGGFMVTEYGRNDSTPSSTEYVVNQGALRAFVESADFINQLPAIKKNFGDEYAAILNDLRTEQTGGVAAAITDDDQAQTQTSTPTSTDSSEKSVTEQLVQHLKDSGFTVYDTNGNVDENNFETEGVQFFQKKHFSTETDDYEQRLQTILDEAPRDSKGRLLAPNGEPSNLPERLYAQVRTKEFKDWFGDWQNDPENASKVVDENGEPRVVYHGSNQYGFDVFDPSYSDDKISLFASSSNNSNQVKSAGGENKTFSRTNNNIHFFKDSKGVVYGYVDDAGIIHLNKNKIRPEHPIHEYTHIWDRVVALKNPSLWTRGVELMKQFDGGKLWNEIANSEFYGKKWSNMSDAQREFMIASEVHARLVGEGGAKLISEIEAKQGSSDIISKLKDWSLKFWQSLKQTFSDWSYADIETLTLKDFNHMTLRDFVTSNAEVAYNETDASLPLWNKLHITGFVEHDNDIELSDDVQRAIDKIKAISPNEEQYITPVIIGETFITGVSLIDAINITAKIFNADDYLEVSDKVVREKISRILYSYDREALFNLLSFGTVPNSILLMLADYMNYDDARGLVAHYIGFELQKRCQKKSYDDVAIPIIKSIDVKYDDSRQQSLFNDDIMKHCKGN